MPKINIDINPIEEHMVKCIYENCNKQASFGEVFGQSQYCRAHKLPSMTDCRHRRCEMCDTQATYGVTTLDRDRTRCYFHRDPTMVSSKFGTCRTYQCQSRSTSRHSEYCYRCEILLSRILTEEDNISKTEYTIACYLTDYFPDLFLHWDKKILDKYKYRPDFYFDLTDYLIIVELDEHQHKNTCKYNPEKEMERINCIHTVSGLPMYIVRINPSKYIRGGVSMNPDLYDRLPVLRKTIQDCIQRGCPTGVETILLFFNSDHVDTP